MAALAQQAFARAHWVVSHREMIAMKMFKYRGGGGSTEQKRWGWEQTRQDPATQEAVPEEKQLRLSED